MRAWVIETGEPLPLPGTDVRVMRAGMIAKELCRQEVETTWWASTFSHPQKQYVAEPGQEFDVLGGVKLHCLHGRPYEKNVSIARLLNHREVAQEFRKAAQQVPRPDVIFCCYPTIDLAYEAVQFGQAHDVPVVLDVRDLWPEVFVDLSPLPEQMTRLILSPLFAKARKALLGASAVTSITEPFLEKALGLAGRARHEKDKVVHLAYNRVEPSEAEQADAIRFWKTQGLKLDGSELISCFFGNLSSVPDFDTAVGALPHLTGAASERARMVICGAGEKLGWLQEQSKSHPQLVAPGRVGQIEIAVLMEHAHLGLLIYPNRDDLMISYPNKVGEYLSRGLPILSTLDGLAGQLLRDEGIGRISPSGDTARFARQFEDLLENETVRTEMSANAARVFGERFDASQVFQSLAHELIQLAAAKELESSEPRYLAPSSRAIS